MSRRPDFRAINDRLTDQVVAALQRAGRHRAVITEAPPGAGKSTLTASVAKRLIDLDRHLRLAIVTQTNEQADDLTLSIARRFPDITVARMTGADPNLPADLVTLMGTQRNLTTGTRGDEADVAGARIVVSTARKWQYERSRTHGQGFVYPIALIDEAYQMRSDMLLGIADLFETLFCVGDPGQLDPFTVIDDSLWKGLPYSPSKAALAVLRSFHPDLRPIQMPMSWRLPPSAVGIVSDAFYPFTGFTAGTLAGDRTLVLGTRPTAHTRADAALRRAAATGWAYVELPERFTLRADQPLADEIAAHVVGLLERGADVIDERDPGGRRLEAGRIAVVAAHNDQVHAVRYALTRLGQDPDQLVVSTANRIQGREYDVLFVWHPLAGRRDATAFHLESGRMCVMLSRHRHACLVFGRAGADRLLEEFPDTEPVFLDEPEKFPDGWEANHRVLTHLQGCKS